MGKSAYEYVKPLFWPLTPQNTSNLDERFQSFFKPIKWLINSSLNKIKLNYAIEAVLLVYMFKLILKTKKWGEFV